MKADRLLALYDRIADAPDALPRLRRFVLDLAVRGKLVPQDLDDEPAATLVERISVRKKQLTAEGQIKKEKKINTGIQSEEGYLMPFNWNLTTLGHISVCLDHMRIPVNKEQRTMRNSGKDITELYPYFGATQQQGWIDDYIFDEELILLGEDGIPFFDPFRKKSYIISGKSWVNNHAHVFRGIFVSNRYLCHWLNTFDYSGRVVGATRAKLNQARALDIPIMLPPLGSIDIQDSLGGDCVIHGAPTDFRLEVGDGAAL